MNNEPVRFYGPPICVVGNINRDVKVQGVPDSPAVMRDGETSVPPISETIGGGGANSACAAAALGAEVRFLGKAGTDKLAERLCQAMESHGVRTHLARDPQVPTGTTVALGFTSGQRHFLSCLTNNETLAFEELDRTAFEGCAHLLRADVWFSKPMLEGGNHRLFAEARQRGLKTSLDINFDPCWSNGSVDEIRRRKHQLRSVLPLVDFAHGNAHELQEFTDSADLDTALARLLEWGVGAVVVHLGTRGAGFFTKGEWLIEPPDPAENPVHSTGTGDVLSTCMILMHSRNDLTTRRKLQLANRVVREFMEGRRQFIPVLQA